MKEAIGTGMFNLKPKSVVASSPERQGLQEPWGSRQTWRWTLVNSTEKKGTLKARLLDLRDRGQQQPRRVFLGNKGQEDGTPSSAFQLPLHGRKTACLVKALCVLDHKVRWWAREESWAREADRVGEGWSPRERRKIFCRFGLL